MAEALLTGVLGQLAPIITSGALEEVKLIRGIKKDVSSLKSNLEAICALLEDAEEKQWTDQRIKFWLEELKGVAYDMEEVLDEWSFALVLKHRTNETRRPTTLKMKVRRLLSYFSFKQLASHHRIGAKIKEINGRLDEIAKRKNNFDLAGRERKQTRRTETTFLVDISQIHGRDEEKRKIRKCLLNVEGESTIQTVSIIGMGGIGKTTLAQVIFNEVEEGLHFDKKIWVCVSNYFDERKVARDILVGLVGADQASTYLQESLTLSALMKKICESINGKKYFLVLDDVWTEDGKVWESLKVALKMGAQGSRILLTTRKAAASKILMESFSTFPLEELSEDVCWSILSQVAFSGRGSKGEHNELEGIGREIARRCKGLPLVAKTLAGLLQDKTTKEEWQKVLNSEIWKLDLVQKDVFAPLLLSFYDLLPPIRQCFMYCVLYPKDTNMYKHRLIYQWMSQGFLGSDNDEDMEALGEDYFNCLAARSFFQDLQFDATNGSIYGCKMHDIVHDFACFLTEQDFVTKLVEVGEHMYSEFVPKKTRHMAFAITGQGGALGPIFRGRQLRSVMGVGKMQKRFELGEKFWTTLFDETSLRLLDLNFLETQSALLLPSAIKKSIHMRYLNLSAQDIYELPEEICVLGNLQYLNLEGTSLKRLPNGIGNLINLRFLLTPSYEYSWVYYPKGVAKLTRLRVLSMATVRGDEDDPDQLSLGDLANLNNLQVLHIRVIGSMNEAEVTRAQLGSKVQLKHVAASFDDLNLQERYQYALQEHLNTPIHFGVFRFYDFEYRFWK